MSNLTNGRDSVKKILIRLLGTDALEQSGIGGIVLSLIPKMGIMTAAALVISLIISRDLRDIPGFLVGYIYACGCLIYLARTCCDAAGCKDIKKAKAMMVRCYLLRFFGLFMLGAVALWFGFMSFAGVLIPQLFPKILLSLDGLLRKKD